MSQGLHEAVMRISVEGRWRLSSTQDPVGPSIAKPLTIIQGVWPCHARPWGRSRDLVPHKARADFGKIVLR